jgi:hypothetical protein
MTSKKNDDFIEWFESIDNNSPLVPTSGDKSINNSPLVPTSGDKSINNSPPVPPISRNKRIEDFPPVPPTSGFEGVPKIKGKTDIPPRNYNEQVNYMNQVLLELYRDALNNCNETNRKLRLGVNLSEEIKNKTNDDIKEINNHIERMEKFIATGQRTSGGKLRKRRLNTSKKFKKHKKYKKRRTLRRHS